MNEDSTLKTEVYLKEVVFVLHHEGIWTQLYMEVTEELQVPSTLTPRNVPHTQWTWDLEPRADMDTSVKRKISYPYFKVAHPHCY